jgi:hypothetical protein
MQNSVNTSRSARSQSLKLAPEGQPLARQSAYARFSISFCTDRCSAIVKPLNAGAWFWVVIFVPGRLRRASFAETPAFNTGGDSSNPCRCQLTPKIRDTLPSAGVVKEGIQAPGPAVEARSFALSITEGSMDAATRAEAGAHRSSVLFSNVFMRVFFTATEPALARKIFRPL